MTISSALRLHRDFGLWTSGLITGKRYITAQDTEGARFLWIGLQVWVLGGRA